MGTLHPLPKAILDAKQTKNQVFCLVQWSQTEAHEAILDVEAILLSLVISRIVVSQ